ncbi:UNVERIFIED_CONTAM: hypothetical protein FKN15_014503 [Acipenser sinensis]
MMAEQFVPDGPQLKLYNYEDKHWDHLMNWQHATMYLFFGISAAVSITVHTTGVVPIAFDRLLLAIAVFVEGFLFYYHLHGRLMLDVHVHQLLLFAIFGGALTIFLEVFFRGNILLELLRCSLCLLQGSWLWQIGFVLYPPSSFPEWDSMDHNNMMFITMCYCWHYAFALLTVAAIFTIISCAARFERVDEHSSVTASVVTTTNQGQQRRLVNSPVERKQRKILEARLYSCTDSP